MCNKIQFSSARDARDYLKTVAPRAKDSRKKKDIRKMRPYKCPNCEYFHLTSLSASERKAERKKSRKLALIRSKVNEYLSLTSITERWRWLAKNECDFIEVVTGDVSVVRFKGYRKEFYID